MTSLDALWYGHTRAAQLGRLALAPPAMLYGGIVRLRGTLYDLGVLRSRLPAIPVLSVGNISVGGTGKTPVAAWAAAELRAAGARPAVLLRGYGEDEPLVHAALNPDVPVIVDADRVAGVEQARVASADCVILDDGFQHRRIARTADWVLVAAEHSTRGAGFLPAGPLRESERALARADIVIVTRKSASVETAHAMADRLGQLTKSEGAAVCALVPHDLVDAQDGRHHPLESLRGARVVAVAAIGAPSAFFAQLREAGVSELHEIALRDHHRFDVQDIERIARAARGADAVVCTLKDAVKLTPQWLRGTMPLWYLSQRVEIERGRHLLEASLAVVLSARAGHTSTAGAAG